MDLGLFPGSRGKAAQVQGKMQGQGSEYIRKYLMIAKFNELLQS